jgi:hypothetical protein
MLKRIHVNQHVIRRNTKTGERVPPLTVKTSRGNYRAESVRIEGASEVIYSPDRPLSCGARVWIETRAPVIITRSGEEVTLRSDGRCDGP